MRVNSKMRLTAIAAAVLTLALPGLTGTALAQEDFLYLVGSGLNGVWRFDGGTGAPLGISGTPGDAVFVPNNSGGLANVLDVALGPDGNLYVVAPSLNGVYRFDGVTGDFIDHFVPNNSAGIANLTALSFGPDGHVYLLGAGINGVWRFDGNTGEPLGVSGTPGDAVFVTNNSAGIFNTVDLDFGPDDNLYVVAPSLNGVYRFDGVTGDFIDHFVPNNSAGIANLTALTFGPDGHVYLLGGGINGVWRFDGSSGEPLGVSGTPGDAVFVANNTAGIFNTVDLDFGPDDNLYVVAPSINGVYRFDGVTGGFIDHFVPNNSAGIANLTGIRFGGTCGIAVERPAADTLITFSPSTPFDVVAGLLSDLRLDEDFSLATCLGTFSGNPAVDTMPDPPIGDGRYYLVRGQTGCVAEGYGDSSFIPDPRDSLDAANPCP